MDLRELFFKERLKQVQVAKEVGINHSILCKVINGWMTPPKWSIKPLAKHLGITEKELLENKIKRR